MAALRKVGKHGSVTIPAELLRQYGIEEGSLLLVEGREDGVLFRPTGDLPADKAQRDFLLETQQAYAELRSDPAAWQAELAERATLEGTLLDGLDLDEIWTEDDFISSSGMTNGPRDEQ